MEADNDTFWLHMFRNQLKIAWSTNSWLPDFNFCLLTLVPFFSASKRFCLFLTQVGKVFLGNFGFKSNVTSPQNKKFTPFEKGLYDMVRRIEFKSIRNDFQSTLREDWNKIKSWVYSCLLIKQRSYMKCHPVNTKRYWTMILRRRIERPIPIPNETSTKKPKNSLKNWTWWTRLNVTLRGQHSLP